MEKTWNINGLNDKLESLVNHYLNNPADKETMIDGFKRIFRENGINDSKFKLFKVSVSGNLAEIEGESAETYALKFAERILKSTGRDNVVTDEEKNAKDPEVKPKKYYTLNLAKIQPETSKIKLKSTIIEGLLDAGIDPYAPVTEATVKNLDINADINRIMGRPLIDGLVELVEDFAKNKNSSRNKTSEESKIEHDSRETNEEPLVDREEIKPQKENPEHPHKPKTAEEDNRRRENLYSKESTVDMSKVGESSNDVNYFVGYDKEKVGRLFEEREDLFAIFVEFVKRFNNVMNKLIDYANNEKQIDDLENDISLEYGKIIAVCGKYGGDGSQVKNLCDGMVTIIKGICIAKKDGKDINGVKFKQNLEASQAFDHTNDGGLKRGPKIKAANNESTSTQTSEYVDIDVISGAKFVEGIIDLSLETAEIVASVLPAETMNSELLDETGLEPKEPSPSSPDETHENTNELSPENQALKELYGLEGNSDAEIESIMAELTSNNLIPNERTKGK